MNDPDDPLYYAPQSLSQSTEIFDDDEDSEDEVDNVEDDVDGFDEFWTRNNI